MLAYDGSFPENAHSTVIGDISEINSDDKGGQQPARIDAFTYFCFVVSRNPLAKGLLSIFSLVI